MKTRAAVAFEAKQPLEIVELDLEGPKAIVISRGFNGKEIGLVVFIRGLGGSSRQIHAEEVLAPTITRQKTANEKCFFYMCDYANFSTFLRGCEWT